MASYRTVYMEESCIRSIAHHNISARDFQFLGQRSIRSEIASRQERFYRSRKKMVQALLGIGFVSIYFATFLASRDAKFIVGIVAVLATFIPLNLFYFKYIRALGKTIRSIDLAQSIQHLNSQPTPPAAFQRATASV